MPGILAFLSSEPEATIASSGALATEAALVAAAKQGDGQAFETLVKRHQRRILAIAVRYTRVRYDAEDVVQLSFQKAFVYLHTFEGKSSFSTWLTRIAINEALMFLRRRRGQHEISIDEDSIGAEGAASRSEIPDADPDPETSYLRQEQARILSAALRELRPGLRRAIELRELAELSTEETARRMGLSVVAVKARVFHGKRKLREALRRCMRKTHKRRKDCETAKSAYACSERPGRKWQERIIRTRDPHGNTL